MVKFACNEFEASFKTSKVKVGNVFVADDNDVAVSDNWAKRLTCPINQIGSDDNVISTIAEANG